MNQVAIGSYMAKSDGHRISRRSSYPLQKFQLVSGLSGNRYFTRASCTFIRKKSLCRDPSGHRQRLLVSFQTLE